MITIPVIWLPAFAALCLVPPLALYLLSTILIRRVRFTILSIRLQAMLHGVPDDCWTVVGYHDEYGFLITPDWKLEEIPQQRLMVIHGMVFREQYQ